MGLHIQRNKYSLPLYGPLSIEDDKSFLEEQKVIFYKCYPVPCPFKVKLDEFALRGILGKGGFGKVVLVERKSHNNRLYALKIINKKFLVENNYVEFALNEKRILQSINFPFCIRLEHLSMDSVNLYLIVPFITPGQMSRQLRKLKQFMEGLAIFYAGQIVLALEYLHFCDVVHRDLKPENVLIDHLGYLKIIDFGLAKVVTTRTYTFCGTPEYIAPEIILNTGHGKAADYWSLGVLIFEMVSGYTPFFSEDEVETFNNIASADYKMPVMFNEDLRDLITGLLQKNVTHRYGNLHRGVDCIKEHSWFKEIDWIALLNRRIIPPYIPRCDVLEVFPETYSLSVLTEMSSASAEEEDYGKYFEQF